MECECGHLKASHRWDGSGCVAVIMQPGGSQSGVFVGLDPICPCREFKEKP